MKAGWIFHPRNLVVYGIILTVGVLIWRYEIKPWIPGGIIAFLLVVYYFGLPVMAMRRLPAFDAELYRLLVKGDADRLLPFYKKHLMLRAFAPPGLMNHRLGQIHAARRVWPMAFQAYHEALRELRMKDTYALVLGYAEAAFHSGEDAAMKPILPGLVKDPRTPAAISFMLVHVMVSGGAKDAEIRKALDEWKARASSDGDLAVWALADAEAVAREGRYKAALSRLEEIDRSLLPEAVRPLAVLLEAKIHHVEGRPNQARKLFDEVRKDPAAGRARIELRDFLDEDQEQHER